MMFGPEPAYFPELFGTRVRYSGASVGFQLSAALGGGFAPIIATALAGYVGGTAGVSRMLILLTAITSFIVTLFATETKGETFVETTHVGLSSAT
jgi:MFS transporter, MHS family, shikimate and dehydroshikimate transport protein